MQALAPRSTSGASDASGSIALLGINIPYTLDRSPRARLAVRVSHTGLLVRSPRLLPQSVIDDFLHQHARWIVQKHHDAKTRHAKLSYDQVQWREGGTLLVLGQPYQIRLGAALSEVAQDSQTIYLCTPKGSQEQGEQGVLAAAIQATALALLKRKALALFEARLQHYAPQLGVQYKGLKLSSAQSRWGSAKSDGTIRLNLKLIHFSQAVIDYVVVHELSHLRHMNHSPPFWQTVASVMPDYKVHQKTLKSGG